MIALTGDIDAFRRELSLAMAKLDRDISRHYADWTQRVFRELVEGSAQWSGNMVANWNYSVGQADYSYTQLPNKTGQGSRFHHPLFSESPLASSHGVFEAGHPLAVNDAMLRMQAVRKPSWRDKVFITNATPMEDGTPLQEGLRDGRVKVRPVNLVGGQVVTMYTIALKYGGTA